MQESLQVSVQDDRPPVHIPYHLLTQGTIRMPFIPLWTTSVPTPNVNGMILPIIGVMMAARCTHRELHMSPLRLTKC